jgi:hypothetical protein
MISKKKAPLLIGFIVFFMSLLVTTFYHTASLSAQAAAAKAKCYSFVQGTSTVQRAPEGVCEYDLMKSAGFTMGSLPNPFPPGECYLWPDSGDPKKVDCEESIYKTAAEWGDNNPPPASLATLPSNGQGPNAGNVGNCPAAKTSFFGIPTWYEYLPVGDNCAVKLELETNPNQVWLIGLAIADILLTLSGLIAVFFVIYGGYRYITSQFDPEGTKKAKDTVLNALIGLIIAILSTALVNFIGKTLQ